MPIVSDNEDLRNRYANLCMVEIGETAITFNTIQHFMDKNLEGIQYNLDLFEKYKKKVLRSGKSLEIDYNYFYALLARDKTKTEEAINALLALRVHKQRNDSPVLGEIVSFPALGYAKLAWRYGIEVEIDSHLVPK
jgi:hypothetical protein